MATYYIGADVHSNSIEMAIRHRKKVIKRYAIPASISAAVQVLNSLPGKKYMAIEEGPMSGWLYRNLHQKVERFVIADPRRNKLISSDGDHDDKIDAAKLALLLAGGYLREVYHSDDEQRVELKHWVGLYHDRIRDAALAKLYSDKGEIAWGSQIRSYVLQPYQMVKDHRTDFQTGNVQAVLDGEIDPFIETYLRHRAKQKSQK